MAKNVLVLAPHPDDAEFFVGGTIAKLAADGAVVTIVIATDGSKGSYSLDSESLKAIRAEEAYQAAQVLGAQPPIMLGHVDMELDRLPPGKLREEFVRLIRTYQPDLVIAQEAFANNEIHPDHRAVAWAAVEAIHYAPLPLVYPEQISQGLHPHYVREKYYYLGTPQEPFYVDISQTLEVKIAAMLEHHSQVEALVGEILNQAQMAGVDLRQLLGDSELDKPAIMSMYLRMQAAQAGTPANLSCAEVFRYERYEEVLEELIK